VRTRTAWAGQAPGNAGVLRHVAASRQMSRSGPTSCPPVTTVTSASAPAEGRRLEHCPIDMLHTPSDGHDWDGYTELSHTRFNYGKKILRRTELSVRGPSYKRETLSGLTFVATLTRPGIRQATLQPPVKKRLHNTASEMCTGAHK